jgi:hypothetical protein
VSTDRDTTRIVRSWLRTEEHESADRVLDAVLDQLDTTPQRRATGWRARRFSPMNAAVRIALASVAVVAIALVGISIYGAQNVADPADPTPTPQPTPIPRTIPDREGTALDAGIYAMPVPGGIVVTVSLPDGWESYGSATVVKNQSEPTEALLGVRLVDQAYTHPCQWEGALPDLHPGYGVEDLADALANQALRGDAIPTDVTVDGFAGKLIELTVPLDIDFAGCDQAEFRSWDDRYHQGPGQHDSVYIIDVEGVRLVIDAAYLPGTSGDDRAELQAILDSIQIDP